METTRSELKNYQTETRIAARYPNLGTPEGLKHVAVELLHEVGEMIVKIDRFKAEDRLFTAEQRKELEDDLGDIMWHTSQCASELGVPLSKIAENNLNKNLAKAEGLSEGE
jgi:NTP pyrophosphatase (non-canonical NTP hydrolase)